MSHFPQADFSSLGLAIVKDPDIQTLEEHHGFTAIQRAGSTDSLKSEPACEAEKSYCPINFISDEAREMIRDWELSFLKKLENSRTVDSMDLDSFTSNSLDSIWQPTQLISLTEPPPKRFYRTFWISLTRRILKK